MIFPGPISLELRNRHFLAADLVIFAVTPTVAFVLRMDGWNDFASYISSLIAATLIFAAIKFAVFYLSGMYRRLWRYASVDEMAHIIGAGLSALVIQTLLFLLIMRPLGLVTSDFPRSLPVVDGLITLLAVGCVRYSARMVEATNQKHVGNHNGENVLVAGAGAAGVLIVQEMQRNPQLGLRPVGFVDDAPEKQRMRIRGLPVLGRCSEIQRIAASNEARQVIIAMPTAAGSTIRQIVHTCEQAGVRTKIIPGMYELLGGTVSLKQLRDVEIEDLLRRESIRTDLAAVGELLRGKRVLVTGGGGSIGSEVCRQVLRFEPEALLILGHGENSIFNIHNELDRLLKQGLSTVDGNEAAQTELRSVIADIRFPTRIRTIFNEYKPDVVFHSAAHKHVPLMETNPSEAITNNVLGTRNVLEASLAAGVEHFVLISTDKAVNPTSIMGASKRVAELLVHQAALQSGKPYVAVRFGNVLGSRGSVVLTFKQQIAFGGPVTVTHPAMTRFFMTISEAVQLVLQAAPLGRGGEVLMLDMGQPVKIVDLARDLIELSGLQIGRDIDIEFSGVRPGEKLFEELFIEGETYERTRHEKIFIVGNASNFVPANMDARLDTLTMAAQLNDQALILNTLKSLVPEFQSPDDTARQHDPDSEPVDASLPRIPQEIKTVPLVAANLATAEARPQRSPYRPLKLESRDSES